MNKKNRKLFFRSFKITTILLFCICLLTFGCFKAYEGMQKIGYGEYKNAIEISNTEFRILDFILFSKS